jgi:uncharacterized SAM-binding protein YcdF (DUF218 family)
VVTIGWFARGFLLTAFTNIWVIDEAPVPADVVVVFGGGVNTRTFAAAEAYKEGLVPKVLIPDVKLEPIEKLGLVKTHSQVCKEVVIGSGVPESAIEMFGKGVSNTWDEVHALKAWADANNADTIIIPTQFIYTRRLRWVLDKVFEGSETQTYVFAIEAFNYERASWWSNEYGLLAVQNEIIKYILYRFKY